VTFYVAFYERMFYGRSGPFSWRRGPGFVIDGHFFRRSVSTLVLVTHQVFLACPYRSDDGGQGALVQVGQVTQADAFFHVPAGDGDFGVQVKGADGKGPFSFSLQDGASSFFATARLVVVGVDASLVAAQVNQHRSLWDGSNQPFIGDAVGLLGAMPQAEQPVPVQVQQTLPHPAASLWVFSNLTPKAVVAGDFQGV
jgi:hypothetical protein